MEKIEKVKPGTTWVEIKGEGVCDFCDKEVIGTLFIIENYGDACQNCFDKIKNNKPSKA